FGVGIGNSVQKHQWLPYAENDFIFAVIGEELGFVGALALIALFAALLVQGVCIALRAPDLYGTLLGIGIISQVGWQVFLHIGVGTALLPNTGISLPFFSSGGTSLLLLLGEMGVMLSISRAGNAREKRLADQHRAETERILQHSRYRKTTV
ncbi:FtsW/RodA/SpoVE family cell cycle protein, partial [Gemmiger sp.]